MEYRDQESKFHLDYLAGREAYKSGDPLCNNVALESQSAFNKGWMDEWTINMSEV